MPMPTPPRPRATRSSTEEPEGAPPQPLTDPPSMRPIDVVFERPPAEPAEIDKATQQMLTDVIAKAVAAHLGSVRISSMRAS